jgi:O-antigen/teichoic acid export membrane protein
MSLVRRSVTSSLYNIVAKVVSLIVGFVGSIALARLSPHGAVSHLVPGRESTLTLH